jgi:hypothetical protein
VPRLDYARDTPTAEKAGLWPRHPLRCALTPNNGERLR